MIKPIPSEEDLNAAIREVHHVHHVEPARPRVSIKIERNSRGVNFEVIICDAASEQEAVERAKSVYEELAKAFPQQEVK